MHYKILYAFALNLARQEKNSNNVMMAEMTTTMMIKNHSLLIARHIRFNQDLLFISNPALIFCDWVRNERIKMMTIYLNI